MLQFKVPISNITLLSLLVLLYHIRIGNSHFEVYGVSDRIMVLVWTRGVLPSYLVFHSDLVSQILIISPLFFPLSHFLHILILFLGHLILRELLVKASPLLHFHRFSPLFFLHLVLKVVPQHIPFLVHPHHPLFLGVGLFSGKLLLLFAEKLLPLLFPFLNFRGSFVVVD